MTFVDIFQTYILPIFGSSAVASVVTYVFARRKRNNDFLQELQASIELLSTKYSEVLKENVTLKENNAELLANQKELTLKIDNLNKKVDRLTKELKKQNENEN